MVQTMKKTVTFDWNFDLETAKEHGVVLVVGKNKDGSTGIGYMWWSLMENEWLNDDGQKSPNFTPKAWIDDGVLWPFEDFQD